MDRKSLLRLVLFALAVQVLYALGLGHTPPHLHRDEVDIALQAHSISTTGRDLDGRLLPLYFRMHNLGPHVWFHPLIVYVTAVFLWFLPFTEAALRFPTTVIATLNVVLMYFVARRLFGTERWAFFAAALLAMTPAHFLHGRLLFDFIYPLPFVLTWLLCLLKYLDAGRPWMLFAAATALGAGVFSYIASVIMMPVYLALTALVLVVRQRVSLRTCAIAAAGFLWPLLLWIPWFATQPTFVAEVFNRYGVTGGAAALPLEPAGSSIVELVRSTASHFRFSKVAERVTLYWAFFDPAFLYLDRRLYQDDQLDAAGRRLPAAVHRSRAVRPRADGHEAAERDQRGDRRGVLPGTPGGSAHGARTVRVRSRAGGRRVRRADRHLRGGAAARARRRASAVRWPSA